MALRRGVDTGDSAVVLVAMDKLKKKRLPSALRDKNLLDFERHKKKQDWEQKLVKLCMGIKLLIFRVILLPCYILFRVLV